ncbi:MAG: hypothetical protein E7323_07190 [Clostridiales bacterium]|nr:hypothetical protein [Clostridiales bacterium]
MDGLITLLIILSVVFKIFGKSKKKATTASKAAPKMEEVFSWEGKTEPRTVAQPTVREPERSAMSPEQIAQRKAELRARFDEKQKKGESLEGYSRPLAASEELAAGRAPGSLAYHSDEGRDVCDPTLGHGESSLDMTGVPVFAPHKEDEPLFTADDMVRGFVMGEIFNRPSVNRWKR